MRGTSTYVRTVRYMRYLLPSQPSHEITPREKCGNANARFIGTLLCISKITLPSMIIIGIKVKLECHPRGFAIPSDCHPSSLLAFKSIICLIGID